MTRLLRLVRGTEFDDHDLNRPLCIIAILYYAFLTEPIKI